MLEFDLELDEIAGSSPRELSDRDVLSGVPQNHELGNRVAALTESPIDAEIDAANGLRGHGGRRPVPEDFADILTTPDDDLEDVLANRAPKASVAPVQDLEFDEESKVFYI